MIKNSYKYLIICLLVTGISCSSQNVSSISKETINDSGKLSLGPTGGGTIDPKITSGQTTVNYKKGFNSLILNIKLISDSNFKTKDTTTTTPATETKKDTGTTTTPTSEAKTENTVEKVTTELNVNGENLKFDIPKDKFLDNQHKINVTGLKEGDTINLESRVYDKNGKIVGSENVKDKKIDKDFETIDLNITLSINISNTNTNTQNVTVNQTQTVAGPNITINLPQPPAPQQMPAQVQPQVTVLSTSGNTTTTSQPVVQTSVVPQVTTPITPPVDNNCVRPNQADNKIVFEGTSYTICPRPELRNSMNITSCLQPNQEFKVNLPTGKIISICPPPK